MRPTVISLRNTTISAIGSRRTKNSEEGFILLELVIALAVVGIVLVPLLSMFTAAAFSISRGGQETRAVNIAQERMEEFKGMGYAFVREKMMGGQARAVLNDSKDSFERVVILELRDIITDDDDTHGTFHIKPAGEVSVSPASIIFIEVNVLWQEGVKERFVSLSSYLSRR